MGQISWLSEPNGFIKLVALMLSVACACFVFVHGENFFPYTDGFALRIAILVLSTNIGVLMWLFVTYSYDNNLGYTAYMEVIFDIVSASSNLFLSIITINTCGAHVITNNWFGVLENIIFSLMLFMLALLFFMDMMCYVVSCGPSGDKDLQRIYLAR